MERRLGTLLVLGVAVAYFADTFLPWTKSAPSFEGIVGVTGWSSVPAWVGAVLSILLIVWQLFRVVGVPVAQGGKEHLVAALLGATVGFLAGSGVAYLRFGAFGSSGRITFAYGAWIAVVLAALLLVTSFLELVAYDPELPRRLRETRILPAIDPEPE
jgi:hypothetical protein